jgi:hypothetical protein
MLPQRSSLSVAGAKTFSSFASSLLIILILRNYPLCDGFIQRLLTRLDALSYSAENRSKTALLIRCAGLVAAGSEDQLQSKLVLPRVQG